MLCELMETDEMRQVLLEDLKKGGTGAQQVLATRLAEELCKKKADGTLAQFLAPTLLFQTRRVLSEIVTKWDIVCRGSATEFDVKDSGLQLSITLARDLQQAAQRRANLLVLQPIETVKAAVLAPADPEMQRLQDVLTAAVHAYTANPSHETEAAQLKAELAVVRRQVPTLLDLKGVLEQVPPPLRLHKGGNKGTNTSKAFKTYNTELRDWDTFPAEWQSYKSKLPAGGKIFSRMSSKEVQLCHSEVDVVAAATTQLFDTINQLSSQVPGLPRIHICSRDSWIHAPVKASDNVLYVSRGIPVSTAPREQCEPENFFNIEDTIKWIQQPSSGERHRDPITACEALFFMVLGAPGAPGTVARLVPPPLPPHKPLTLGTGDTQATLATPPPTGQFGSTDVPSATSTAGDVPEQKASEGDALAEDAYVDLVSSDLFFRAHLGEGSTGVVTAGTWQGHDVAIKSADLGKRPQALAAMQNEACMYEHMPGLQSQYIPRMLVHGVLNGFLYCICTSLEGGTLETAHDVVLEDLDSAAAALLKVHEAGVLHGDIALRNFLVSSSLPRRILVADFGNAEVVHIGDARLIKEQNALECMLSAIRSDLLP